MKWQPQILLTLYVINDNIWLRRCRNGKRLSLVIGGLLPPGKGVVHMVTYMELFTFCLVIIGTIGLAINLKKKK